MHGPLVAVRYVPVIALAETGGEAVYEKLLGLAASSRLDEVDVGRALAVHTSVFRARLLLAASSMVSFALVPHFVRIRRIASPPYPSTRRCSPIMKSEMPQLFAGVLVSMLPR